MSKYVIFITVTAQVQDFKELLEQIPDKSLLEIVNNFDNPKVARLCKQAESEGAKIHNHPENLGCGGGWNVALRTVLKRRLDYAVILSPSAKFNGDVNDFIKAIDKREKQAPGYFYNAPAPDKTDTHAFAITRRLIQEVGLYDENIWPVYFEDTDYYRRMIIAGREVTIIPNIKKSAYQGGGVRFDERLKRLHIDSIAKNRDYYVEKWGGEQGSEKFDHPFNEIDKTVDYWPAPRKDQRAELYSVDKFNKLRAEGLI